jgi:hypothetical protein
MELVVGACKAEMSANTCGPTGDMDSWLQRSEAGGKRDAIMDGTRSCEAQPGY